MNKKIRAAWFDLDGTITDGMYHVGANGELTKSFYTRDFWGMHSLDEEGIQVHILTHSDDNVIHEKIKHLSDYKFPIEIHHLTPSLIKANEDNPLYPKSIDKAEYLEWWACNHNIELNEIAYMGDAEGDYKVLKIVGYPGIPADAIDILSNKYYGASLNGSDEYFISKSKGGHGAVYEFCEHLKKLTHSAYYDRKVKEEKKEKKKSFWKKIF